MNQKKLRLSALVVCMGIVTPLLAQIQPDAGQILQEEVQPSLPPQPLKTEELNIQSPKESEAVHGGPSVKVQHVHFQGNTAFTEKELNAVLGDVNGKSYDLEGLRGLAKKITSFYINNGYPFARAYVPEKPVKKGTLTIIIIEGHYGKVTATGDETLIKPAQRFLSSLKSGDLISSSGLERATLILNDQPGIQAMPVMKPGKEFGTGDLEVMVKRTPRFSGEIGADNTGNRYTGKYRARIDLRADSTMRFGDQFVLKALYTDQNMWFGTGSYGLPLASSGVRGLLSYAHTSYHLGEEFDDLDATGTANVAGVGLSYPIIRSKAGNLQASFSYQHKELRDQNGSLETDNRKESDVLPFTLQFDIRDSFALGGVSYGAVTLSYGKLSLDDQLEVSDSSTAQTEGDFQKITLDIARLQAGPSGMMLYGRFSGQWASRNLDSSEGFGLGGVNGIRAYPEGEGYGDEGWLAQFEMRYKFADWSPYLFYDMGGVKLNRDPWVTGQNYRHLAGVGPGVRLIKEKWDIDALAAWRTKGGKPTSDSRDSVPMVWVTGKYRF